jgi:hypothetical protein
VSVFHAPGIFNLDTRSRWAVRQIVVTTHNVDVVMNRPDIEIRSPETWSIHCAVTALRFPQALLRTWRTKSRCVSSHCALFLIFLVTRELLQIPEGVSNIVPGKVNVKLSLCFNWAPRHEGVLRKRRYTSTHSLTSALDGGEWSASRPGRFTPKERASGTHWIGGWMGPRAVLDAMVKRKIPSPRRESNPRTPTVQPAD